MPRKLDPQYNFNAGELSPNLYGRSDVEKYQSGLETCTNCTLLPYGPVKRRNGTKYINEVKTSSDATHLKSFQVSADDAFILEFGDEYIRFYTNGGVVIDATDFTNGTFGSDISSWTDISAGTGSIAHDGTNFRMNLVGGGGGNEARAEQSLSLSQGPYTVTCDVFTGDITLKVGTTSGGTEIGSTTLTTGTDKTYSFTPSAAGTIYFTFENANNDTRAVDNIVLSNTAYEIASPYDTTDVEEIQTTQIADTMYLAHADYAPRKLVRNATADWSLSLLDALPEPTVELGVSPSTTCTPGATTGSGVTFTAGTTTFLDSDIGRQIINLNGNGRASITALGAASPSTTATCTIVEDFDSTDAIASGNWKLDLSPIADLTVDGTKTGSIITIDADVPDTTTSADTFRTTDVGKYVVISNGIVQITERVSGSQVKGEVLKALNSLDETGVWTLEEATWSATRGYPRTVGVFQDRLIFGGTSAEPQTLWFSAIGLYDNFGTGTNDNDAIQVTLGSAKVSRIEWISAIKQLAVGTSNTEITVSSGTAASITPTSIQQQVRTYHGSNLQQPFPIGNEILFSQKSERKVLTYIYDFEIDNYRGQDLTYLSDHITEGNIRSLVYAQEPHSIIYVVKDNGDMLAGTYVRSQQVIGWSKWTTDGSYESVATISNGNKDEVWTIVNRTINGSTVRYVELLDDGTGEDALDGFSDSYLTYSDPKTITGLTAANPPVVTAAAHGYSNGDKVKFYSVGGMTEVNNNSYEVANVTTNTFELQSKTRDNIRSSTYQWTASGSGTDEYYLELSGGGDPSISEPASVYENGTLMTEATVGSLTTADWDYGDNDSLGYSTIYVRLTDGADPDTKTLGFISKSDNIDASAYTAYTSGGEVHKLVSTISGLGHLEGETVQVKTDNGSHPNETVSSGSITLDFDATEVVVGLPYTSTIKTLKKDFDVGLGPMQGQRTRYPRPVIRVYKSILPNLNDNFVPTRVPADEMDQAPALKSGDVEYGPTTWGSNGQLTFTINTPFPFQLSGIFGLVEGGVK